MSLDLTSRPPVQLQIDPGRIVYEDNHYLAYNKAIGELVQGDRTGDVSLVEALTEFIRQRDAKPGNAFMQVIHRIDRPVSGVVLFAKTSKGLARANELFRAHEVQRTYWAIVQSAPAQTEGSLQGYLRRDAQRNKSYFTKYRRGDAQQASLTYKLVGTSTRHFFLEVQLETGRHHQIRALLAAHGMPIRGDLKYGAMRSNPGGGIDLHARSLTFTHPIGREPRNTVHIIAPPPAGVLWTLFGEAVAALPASGQQMLRREDAAAE